MHSTRVHSLFPILPTIVLAQRTAHIITYCSGPNVSEAVLTHPLDVLLPAVSRSPVLLSHLPGKIRVNWANIGPRTPLRQHKSLITHYADEDRFLHLCNVFIYLIVIKRKTIVGRRRKKSIPSIDKRPFKIDLFWVAAFVHVPHLNSLVRSSCYLRLLRFSID